MSILRLSRLGPADILAATNVEGFEELEAGLEGGRGAVIVTGHFGNWEVAGASLTARGVPLDVVAVRQRNRLVDRLIRETRERLGMRVIYRGGSTKELLDSLRQGHAVALVADQDARSRGVFVPFFGRLASTYRGPALLALRSGAPLYLGSVTRRSDGTYAVRVRRLEVPEAGGARRVEAITAQVTAALEAAVREAPGQYFWQHRRWKTRPPEREGGSGGYQPDEGSGAETTGATA
jgi:KDO2-lipid IV(A) lauroyltransferase